MLHKARNKMIEQFSIWISLPLHKKKIKHLKEDKSLGVLQPPIIQKKKTYKHHQKNLYVRHSCFTEF